MPIIVTEIVVNASLERCFDAARDLDLHLSSMAHTGERAIAGRTSGLIELGEEVTWEGRHFGVRQRFTSRITAFDRPHHFQDSMTKGAFRSFVHDHYFTSAPGGTVMRDVLNFASPLGLLGKLANAIVLEAYLRRLLVDHGVAIRQALESRG